MENQSLTVQHQGAVTPWASRPEVREMQERLKTMLPGAQKLNAMELFGLAQAAVAHNLDPFNGELWCIPGKGLMAGIKGHRRAAHRQVNEEAGGNGNYYVEFFQIPTDEMIALKIPAKSLAFRARLHDSQTTRAYVENVERMLKAGMPWEVVAKIVGDQPYTEGIGYYVDGEATKMTPVQCAQKRAEADALKRRFDLPFTMAIGVNGDADIIDAEFTVGNPQQSEQDPAEIQERMNAASMAVRGEQSDIDLGPIWTQNEPENAPEPQNKNGNGDGKKQRTLPKIAAIRYKPFLTWAQEWTSKHPEYRKNDNPDLNHVMARVARLGFSEVTESNMPDVQAALESYANGKADIQKEGTPF